MTGDRGNPLHETLQTNPSDLSKSHDSSQSEQPSRDDQPGAATQPKAESKAESAAPKAESNRRNSRKSTGPRTAAGKARSRLNALKHGILAAQTVASTIEGHDQRMMFEQIVDGLAVDFEPVGTFEQLLVEQVAGCFWRYRRLLQFENRAAFATVDARAKAIMNSGMSYSLTHRPMYTIGPDKLVEADEVYSSAGLDGITIPNEPDTMRVVRYEASINRTMNRALAKLEASRKARLAREKPAPAESPSNPQFQPQPRSQARQDTEVVIDMAAQRRNRKTESAKMLAPMVALELRGKFIQMDRENRETVEAAEAEYEAANSVNRVNDQTKPKTSMNPQDRIAAVMQELRELEALAKPKGFPSD